MFYVTLSWRISKVFGRSKLHVGAPMKDIIHTPLVTFCAEQRGRYIGGGWYLDDNGAPFMAIRFDSQVAGQTGGNTLRTISFDEELWNGFCQFCKLGRLAFSLPPLHWDICEINCETGFQLWNIKFWKLGSLLWSGCLSIVKLVFFKLSRLTFSLPPLLWDICEVGVCQLWNWFAIVKLKFWKLQL